MVYGTRTGCYGSWLVQRFRNVRIGEKNVKLQIVRDMNGGSFHVGMVSAGRYRQGGVLLVSQWDTAGQERFRTITSAYYRGADGIIMVYDITHRESFDNVREWLEEVNRYAAPETCKLLIGNKSDREDRAVKYEEGEALGKELGMPFLETSAREPDKSNNVELAFVRMAEQLINARCVHGRMAAV